MSEKIKYAISVVAFSAILIMTEFIKRQNTSLSILIFKVKENE